MKRGKDLDVAFLSSHPDIFDFYRKHPTKKDKPQIVIAGRSNVGKSSFINHFFNKKNLAKTAKTAGKTRLLNFFDTPNNLWVDLPGYGFAKVSQKQKKEWAITLEEFFTKNSGLFLVILLLDIRRDPSSDDRLFLAFLKKYKIRYVILFTKTDKVKGSASRATRIKDALDIPSDIFYACYSVKQSQPRKELRGYLCNIKN